MKWFWLRLPAFQVFVWLVAICGTTRADLMSLLLAPPNTTNDALQDRSWRLEIPVNGGERGSKGNILYGLSVFDTLTINGHNINVDRSAWLIFSVTRGDPTTRSFQTPLGMQSVSGNDFAPTSLNGYKLSDLINLSLPAYAMAALVELTVPYGETTYLKQLVNDTAASKSNLDNAIDELATNSKLIAAFGLDGNQDFWFMSDLNPLTATMLEFFGLSVVATGPGITPSYFNVLLPETSQRVDLSQFEFSLRDFMNVTLQQQAEASSEVVGYYTDRGTVLVNVVPEPTSMLTLLGLAGAGLFTQWAGKYRRGKKHSKNSVP
jgi:hypothetical protein